LTWAVAAATITGMTVSDGATTRLGHPQGDDSDSADPEAAYPEIVDSEAFSELSAALDGGCLGAGCKLTTARARFIVDAISHGGPKTAACAACGISRFALEHWLERGKAGEHPYNIFAECVYAAEGMAELTAARAVHGGSRSWAGPAAWLERRRRDRWARDDAITQGATPPPVQIVFLPAGAAGAQTPQLPHVPQTTNSYVACPQPVDCVSSQAQPGNGSQGTPGGSHVPIPADGRGGMRTPTRTDNGEGLGDSLEPEGAPESEKISGHPPLEGEL